MVRVEPVTEFLKLDRMRRSPRQFDRDVALTRLIDFVRDDEKREAIVAIILRDSSMT